jgi:hypothetical protein
MNNHNEKGKLSGAMIGCIGAILAALIIGVATLIAADKIPFPFGSDPNLPQSLNLAADAGWIGTGVYIKNGQSIVISASGKVNTGGSSESLDSPNGSETYCDKAIFEQLANQKYSIDCFLSGAPLGAVIGRVGDNRPFLIGSYFQFPSENAGELFLAVNDCCDINDNSGSFSVTISKP